MSRDVQLAIVDSDHLEALLGQRLVVRTKDGRRIEGRLSDVRFHVFVLDQVAKQEWPATVWYRDAVSVAVVVGEAKASLVRLEVVSHDAHQPG